MVPLLSLQVAVHLFPRLVSLLSVCVVGVPHCHPSTLLKAEHRLPFEGDAVATGTVDTRGDRRGGLGTVGAGPRDGLELSA